MFFSRSGTRQHRYFYIPVSSQWKIRHKTGMKGVNKTQHRNQTPVKNLKSERTMGGC
jgi:hypothetical protein